MNLCINFANAPEVVTRPPRAGGSDFSDRNHLMEAASALSAAVLDCNASLVHVHRGGTLHTKSEVLDGQTLQSVAEALIEIIDLRGCLNADRALRAAAVAWIEAEEARHG